MTQKIFFRNIGVLFIMGMYLFLYIPIVVLIAFSFNKGLFPSPWVGFSLRWYYELMESTVLWGAFYNSLIIALASTALSLFFSLCLVYYESHECSIGPGIYLFYGTIFIPEIVLGIGLLSFLSLCAIPLGITTLIAGHTILGMGYAVPIIYSRYHALDKRVQEASLDLGATRSQTFFKITLPLLYQPLLVAGLLIFIISFDDFVVSFFCAGGEAQTLSLYVYSMIKLGISPVINALSTILFLLSSCLVLLFCSLTVRSKVW